MLNKQIRMPTTQAAIIRIKRSRIKEIMTNEENDTKTTTVVIQFKAVILLLRALTPISNMTHGPISKTEMTMLGVWSIQPLLVPLQINTTTRWALRI